MIDTVKAPVKQNFLDMDAISLAQAIKEEKTTIVKVVQTYIDRIQRIDPFLNAITEERFSEALEEAKQKDKALKTEAVNKPLYGVPISIKESFHVKGMKTTGGLVHRQDIISKSDAEVVKKLKDAGAIIIGKTNTPTLCFCQETDNKLYGRTNNSWDLTRTAGGSSGGEAALVGAGGSAVGISSDIGGSIRFPSHFNGIIGFKPGKFQVSSVGHFPDDDDIPLQARMLSMGPTGKSVRDIKLIYQLIAKHKMNEQSLSSMKINVLPSETGYPISPRTAQALDNVYKFLQNSFDTTRSIPPYFEETTLLWQEIMSIGGAKDVEKLAFHNERNSVYSSYLKEKLTKRTNVHTYLSWAIIGAKLFQPSQKRINEIEGIIQHGDQLLDDYLQNQLLIFPVYHRGALKHGELFKEIFSIKKTFLKYLPYIAYANVWGLPSLTIPVDVDEYNMPIGIQIMSINGNEDAIFKLGEQIVKQFRGYKRSTLFD